LLRLKTQNEFLGLRSINPLRCINSAWHDEVIKNPLDFLGFVVAVFFFFVLSSGGYGFTINRIRVNKKSRRSIMPDATAPKHILVVEDDASTCQLIKKLLENNGYTVTVVGNGRDALQVVGKRIPDLIISDVCMPEMDGFIFLKELKKIPEAGQVPVMILTVRKSMEDTFMVLGVDEFLVKPFSSEELLARVLRLVTRMRSSAPVAGSADLTTIASTTVRKPYLTLVGIGGFLLVIVLIATLLVRSLIDMSQSRASRSEQAVVNENLNDLDLEKMKLDLK